MLTTKTLAGIAPEMNLRYVHMLHARYVTRTIESATLARKTSQIFIQQTMFLT